MVPSSVGHIAYMLEKSLTILNYERMVYSISSRINRSRTNVNRISMRIVAGDGKKYKVIIEEVAK